MSLEEINHRPNRNTKNVRGIHYAIWGDFIDLRGDVSNISGDIYLYRIIGDPSKIRGDISGVIGDVSTIMGDISNIRGDVSNVFGDVSKISGDISA